MNCYQNIFTRIIICIRHLLASTDFLNRHRVENHFVRKRKLSLRQVVFYLLHTNHCAMHQNISRICDDLPDIDFPDQISKQALSKARQWVLPSLFKELFSLTVRTYYEMIDRRKNWHGYHVFAVDGSKLQLPNSKGNLSHFGQRFNTANPSQVYSMALCSTLYDVLEDMIIDCSLNPDLSSERSAALEHLNVFRSLDLADGIEKSKGMVKDAVSDLAADMVINPRVRMEQMAVAGGGAVSSADLSSLVGAIREAVSGGNSGFGQSGDIVIPVYLGGTILDEVIVNAQQRANLRSGGR